jgi:uncharacterized membrane protein
MEKLLYLISHKATVSILIVVGFLLGGLLFIGPVTVDSPWLLTLGRFHPVLLHFPVVLICLLAGLELLQLYLNIGLDRTWKALFWWVILIATLISILTGYFLVGSGDYQGSLMLSHFQHAIYTGCLLCLAYLLFAWSDRYPELYTIYILVILACAGLVTITSHEGASMTHGKNFLTNYLPAMATDFDTEVKADSQNLVYDDWIQPVLEMKCASCHNNQKAKGDLKLTSYQQLFGKGSSGKAAIIPFDTSLSELYLRISSKDSADGHMPPMGKAPLDRNEKNLLRDWILTGAFATLQPADVKIKSMQDAILQLKPTVEAYQRKIKLNRAYARQIRAELDLLASDLEIIIKPDPNGDVNEYSLSMPFPPVPFDHKKLKALRPYYEVFTKVSVVGAAIEDEDLYYISQMTNLRELYLQKTKLTGKTLIYLQSLPRLEILNLSFTAISDKDILDLVRFPALREVFLYRTQVSQDVIKALNGYAPHIKIQVEEGPYF